MDRATFLATLADACRAAGSQRAWAATHGFSGAYVHDVLAGNRPPGLRIVAALGMREVVSYESAAECEG
jgi:hypothetical protein